MDSGIAAVLSGAITGGVASIGTLAAYRQLKIQVRSEAKLSLREPRRKAYSDYLLECRETSEAVWATVDDETHEAPSGPVSRAIERHTRELQRTLGAVELEGPPEVSVAARSVMNEFSQLYVLALGAFEAGLEEGFSGDITESITRAIDAYIECARAALSTYADI